MKVFRVLVILSSILVFIACGERKSIFGRYSNTFDTLAIHYVDLRGDSTFYHFYKRDSTELMNSGQWSWGKKNKVWFNEWRHFGGIEDESCEGGCIRGVEFRNENELVFSYDLPNEMNFLRQKISD